MSETLDDIALRRLITDEMQKRVLEVISCNGWLNLDSRSNYESIPEFIASNGHDIKKVQMIFEDIWVHFNTEVVLPLSTEIAPYFSG